MHMFKYSLPAELSTSHSFSNAADAVCRMLMLFPLLTAAPMLDGRSSAAEAAVQTAVATHSTTIATDATELAVWLERPMMRCVDVAMMIVRCDNPCVCAARESADVLAKTNTRSLSPRIFNANIIQPHSVCTERHTSLHFCVCLCLCNVCDAFGAAHMCKSSMILFG